ncbi:dephospho-CoA kinase [Deefgea rivuli]|uniref:dephospho-CoA kinase n=1 Tax=Deefgea rivuli TaxID=400948 RepID=UPI000483B297|nr:dephospho-CoA kinase [Deefgea rivuli]
MLIVGLTGGIGSGKSSFCAAFSDLGVPIIDTDDIAHQLSKPTSDANAQVARQFGADALLADGSLNRTWLRQLIFTDPSKKKQLETIFHPLILKKTKEEIQKISSLHHYCIVAVPLLFETTAFRNLIHYSIVIDCDEQDQINRVMLRSKLNHNEVQNIIAAQMPRKQRNYLADHIITNNGTLSSIAEKVSQMHSFLLEKT